MAPENEKIRLMSRLSQQVFKLYGLLQEEGMRMTTDSPVNPSHWRILGVLVRSPTPLTVPQIAREFGQARQSVQRLVDALRADGYVCYLANPAHAKSRLVRLTELGSDTYASLEGQRVQSVGTMADAIDTADMAPAERLLASWIANLERASNGH